MKFALVMLAVAPLCCSDLFAYVFTPVTAQAGALTQAGRTLVRTTGRQASRSSRSGCSCSQAGRAYRQYEMRKDDDDSYYNNNYSGYGY